MILTHMINSLKVSGDNRVEIGGRKYRTTQIGSTIWLAENLDNIFSFSENPGGAPSVPAVFYQNILNRIGGGLLYNWYAVKYIEDNKSTLIPGWHVPTSAEYNDLFTSIGGANYGPSKLRHIDWGGTDDYEFSAVPIGTYDSGIFSGQDVQSKFWTITTSTSVKSYYYLLEQNDSYISDARQHNGCSLRLVKD